MADPRLAMAGERGGGRTVGPGRGRPGGPAQPSAGPPNAADRTDPDLGSDRHRDRRHPERAAMDGAGDPGRGPATMSRAGESSRADFRRRSRHESGRRQWARSPSRPGPDTRRRVGATPARSAACARLRQRRPLARPDPGLVPRHLGRPGRVVAARTVRAVAADAQRTPGARRRPRRLPPDQRTGR